MLEIVLLSKQHQEDKNVSLFLTELYIRRTTQLLTGYCKINDDTQLIIAKLTMFYWMILVGLHIYIRYFPAHLQMAGKM